VEVIMAGREPSTTRRRLLGAAAALPVLSLAPPEPGRAEPVEALPSLPDCCEWNRHLARYRRLAAEAEEAATTGWFAAANVRYERECEEIDARHELSRPESAAARRLKREAFERVAAAEEAFWARCTDPMQRAAVALALTPAPNLPALAEKIAVMRTHQLHELDSMTRGCFEVLEEDLYRAIALQTLVVPVVQKAQRSMIDPPHGPQP
jgi:hypothetical protein